MRIDVPVVCGAVVGRGAWHDGDAILAPDDPRLVGLEGWDPRRGRGDGRVGLGTVQGLHHVDGFLLKAT